MANRKRPMMGRRVAWPETRAPWLEFVSAIVEGSEAAYAVDNARRILAWNKGAEKLLGHEAGDVLGRCCYQVLHGEEDWDCPSCNIHWDPVVFLPCRQRWLSVVRARAAGPGGEEHVLLCFLTDITRQMRILLRFEGILTKVMADLPQAAPNRDARYAQEVHSEHLTNREREVLSLLVEGQGAREIAEQLCISVPTARNHIQSILGKLGVHSKAEAVVMVYKGGLIAPANGTKTRHPGFSGSSSQWGVIH